MLEIQAFPQQRWQQFKDQLRSYIELANDKGLGTFNLIMI